MNAKDMLARANSIKQKTQADNTSFIKSRITQIKLPDKTADCIISNCVINLVPEPEKQLVFDELFRLLKPGGRIAISDILLKKELPQNLRDNMALYVGCVAGASLVAGYQQYLRDAGFEGILIVGDESDLNVYKNAEEGAGTGCCGPKTGDGRSSCGSGAKKAQDEKTAEDINLNKWASKFDRL